MSYFIAKSDVYDLNTQEKKEGYWLVEADSHSEAMEMWYEEDELESLEYLKLLDHWTEAQDGEPDRGFIGFSEISTPS